MNELDPAIPCGIVAKSFFNDTYELWKQTGVEKDLSQNSKDVHIPINQGNIAWSSDVTYKFSNIKQNIPAGKDFMDLQWHDLRDCKCLIYSFNLYIEHFIVWMRTAGLAHFRKLWGSIPELPVGKYYLRIRNNYNVEPFKGTKSFVISTTNSLGGKNYFLAACYLTIGSLCMAFTFIICVVHLKKGLVKNPN